MHQFDHFGGILDQVEVWWTLFVSKIISHKSKKNVIMLCLSQYSLIFCHQMPMVSVTVSIEQNIPRDAIKTYL